ncbi:MAG: ABC-type sugar transport system permease component [Caldanaerobacter subterraneus]|uniref:Sugar ABC transporter permease n=2 Tax=Caldanaerobacter subterraneus TaxID=911092 RepID=A0A101E684_9THEO|nr:MAG: ABC-type sugar transport system permease component [Caldanaerobacter subterraneus]HBT48875.1 sugar ABC transporter permease [Caldanaerobacter subterraneus]
MRKSHVLSRLSNMLFVLPAVAFFITFSIYPLYKTFQLSFFDWNGIAPTMNFVGLQNYITAFSDKVWWKAVYNGFYLAVLALIFMNSLALFLAILVNNDIRGASVYRVIFYIPPILSGIVVGYIWKWIYDPTYGILNAILEYLHLGFLKHAWLSDVKTALLSVAVASIWQGFGGSFIIFLAGLQGIPQELYEAAKVDGASAWEQFRWITLPLLSKTYTIVSILTILGAMQLLTLVLALTNGGPGFETEVPALRIYKEAFSSYRFGYATALSVILGLMLLIISLIQIKLRREE